VTVDQPVRGSTRVDSPTATTRMATRAVGTGPAVLWVHGYTMDSSIWPPLWRLLPGWRHVGVDLLGHGTSGPLRAGTTLPDLAAELGRIAASEGATRVVALSFGSSVALQLAIDQPDVVRQLVLGAPTVAGAPAEPGTQRRHQELVLLHRILGPGPQMARLWMQSPPDIFRCADRHPDLADRLRTVIARHGWDELVTGAMGTLTDHRHTPADLRRIEADTLVVVGGEDMPTFVANADLLARAVDRCRVVSLPRSGHLCLIERPAEIAPAIAAHLVGSPLEHAE
jgi:3-oxoadipate enol-lactonase